MDTKTAPSAQATGRTALARDPLSTDDILAGFYRPEARTERRLPTPALPPEDEAAVDEEDSTPQTSGKPRPTHYKVVCISLYTQDIERLESLVAELKRRGHSKANKSQVIREALLQIDLDRVPRQH